MSTVHKLENLPCLHAGCQATVKNIRQYLNHRQKHLTPLQKLIKYKPKTQRRPKPKVTTTTGQRAICELCGASFKYKSGLKTHLKFVHEGKPRNYEDTTCQVCGMVIRAGRFKSHMLRKHRDQWGEGDGDRGLFQCGVVGCKRWFIKKESLDKHVEKIHKGNGGEGRKPTFECKTCGMGFYFKGRLEIHELTHGDKLKEFFCDLCGKGFGMEKNLDNHKKFKKCKMVERTMEEF